MQRYSSTASLCASECSNEHVNGTTVGVDTSLFIGFIHTRNIPNLHTSALDYYRMKMLRVSYL